MSRDEIESVELRASVLCTPQARASKKEKLAELAQLKAAAARVIAGGLNRWPSYTQPGQMANYFTPDDDTDRACRAARTA